MPYIPDLKRPLALAALLSGLLLFLTAWPALAWRAAPPQTGHNPVAAVLVDKGKQEVYLVRGEAITTPQLLFRCTTGQSDGDKMVEGDLKTPEGVYFVTGYLNIKANYPMYGGSAYTLNYPNPVDRLLGKKGYGIWVHGRGKELIPKDTQGCVALPEIVELGRYMPPGSPVIIAESIDFSPAAANATALAEIAQATLDWNKAWANRSETFLSFYDPEKYSRSTEAFGAFAANKIRLFGQLPWIKIDTGDVVVLDGPGYWVSYFYQNYQAPNLSTQGIRRLYWQQDSQGALKIIGMEWDRIPKHVYEQSQAELKQSMKLLAESGPPASLPSKAVVLAEAATGAAQPVEAVLPVEKEPSMQDIPEPLRLEVVAASPVQTAAQEEDSLLREPVAGISPVVVAQAAPPAPDELRPPEEANAAGTEAALTTTEPPVVEEPAPVVLVAEAAPAVPKIEAAPAEPKSEAKAASADQTREITTLVESWRKAWLKADLKTYISFYDPKARQDKRASRSAIEKQKKQLWQSARPSKVDISNLKCRIDGDTARVTFVQTYSGTNGLNSKGPKTLVLKKNGQGRWLIVKESWGTS